MPVVLVGYLNVDVSRPNVHSLLSSAVKPFGLVRCTEVSMTREGKETDTPMFVC